MHKSIARSRKLIFSAVFMAGGILLPMIFHMFGLGQAFLPMHIPALLAGMLLPWPYALGVGVLTPLLSSLLTGMPGIFPMTPVMMAELGVYALSGSLLAHKAGWKRIPALLLSMLLGRVAGALMAYALVYAFAAPLPATPWAYLISGVSTGLPGLVIQLILLPPLLLAVQNAEGKRGGAMPARQDESLSQKEVAAYFDARAAQWDGEHPVDADKMRTLLACAHVQPGARVLDVGSGTGAAVPFLRELIGENGHITCADVSQVMLDISREKHGGQCEYLLADVTDAAFTQKGLDAVICYNVFPHIRRHQEAIARMAQWLRAGGTLLIAHGMGRDHINNMHRGLDGVVRSDSLPPIALLRAMMQAAGLRILDEIDEPERFAISGRKE